MKREKLFIAILVLALIVLVSVEPVMAFITTRMQGFENKFTPSKVTASVDESFEDKSVKKDVKFENTGDTEVYFRVALTPMWVDDNENIGTVTPILGTDYILNFSNSTKWIKGSDGYYYFTEPVAPGASTDILITSCKPLKTVYGYDNNGKKTVPLHFELDVTDSAIQSTPKSVVTDEWGVTVNDNGVITLAGCVAL